MVLILSRKGIVKTVCHFLSVFAMFGFLISSAQAQQQETMGEQALTAGGKLTLDQCIDIALQRNSQVLIAKGQVDVSEAQAYSAWSNVMPTWNATIANSSRTYLNTPIFINGVQVGSSSKANNNFSAGLSVNQPIYNGGQSWNSITQARQNVKNNQMNTITTENRIVSNVKTQYYSLLRTIRLKEVTEEQVKLNEEQLRRSQSMYEIGSVAKVDVLQARATLGNTRITLYNQETQVRQAQASLNNAMGLDVNMPIDIVDSIESDAVELPPLPMSAAEAMQIALRDNPDIKQRDGNVMSARLGAKISKGALLPTVSGSISYSRNSNEFSGIYGNFGQNWRLTFGLNISLSILNGTRTYANIQQSRANLMIAEENLENTKRSTTLAIKRAILDMEAARQVIELSNENILASEESMRLAEERYRVGSGTLLDVFNAQLTLIRAKSNLVTAQYDYKIAQATLDQSLSRR